MWTCAACGYSRNAESHPFCGRCPTPRGGGAPAPAGGGGRRPAGGGPRRPPAAVPPTPVVVARAPAPPAPPAQPPQPAVPAAPGVAVEVTGPSVQLTWGQVPGATEYHVYQRSQTSGFNREAVVSGTTVHVVTGLRPGSYWFYVVAQGPGGTSGNSNIVAATVQDPRARRTNGEAQQPHGDSLARRFLQRFQRGRE